MSNVTLEKILEEVRAGFTKADGRFAKIEAKVDDRFELVKQEFQSIRSDISERFDHVDARL